MMFWMAYGPGLGRARPPAVSLHMWVAIRTRVRTPIRGLGLLPRSGVHGGECSDPDDEFGIWKLRSFRLPRFNEQPHP